MKRKPRSKEEYLLWGSLRLARDRIGKDPARCLEWIIRFAQMDMTALRSEERTALAKDLALFPVVMEWKPPLVGITNAGAVPDATLTTIQAELRQLFHDLMEGSAWTVPGQSHLRILRVSQEGAAQTEFRAVWETRGNIRDAVFASVARLLLEHGQKVRACPECRRVFVANRRQAYCTARCSQAVRNQRRKEKEG